jgi:hypothetical protein
MAHDMKPNIPDTVISETASEKRQRGRPPIFTLEYRASIQAIYPDVKKHRGITDCMYRTRAFSLLVDDARFSWVADPATVMAGGDGGWKPSILTELGRIWDEEELKEIALTVCELKPKTKDAVAMIRRIRTGKAAAGNPFILYDALCTRLNDYLQHHPDTPLSQAEDVLLVLLDEVRADI